jgi:hypothetical protein
MLRTQKCRQSYTNQRRCCPVVSLKTDFSDAGEARLRDEQSSIDTIAIS